MDRREDFYWSVEDCAWVRCVVVPVSTTPAITVPAQRDDEPAPVVHAES